jgi:hypothetical protein
MLRAMPKNPVQVFWRGQSGIECVLRSTDRGWELAMLGSDGRPVREEPVSSTSKAKRIARRWRHEEDQKQD